MRLPVGGKLRERPVEVHLLLGNNFLVAAGDDQKRSGPSHLGGGAVAEHRHGSRADPSSRRQANCCWLTPPT